MLAHVYCATTIGVEAQIIDVETNMFSGFPKYFLVGLPDRAINESRDRIEAALKNSGASMPRGRITVNLAPADLPKEGSSFDLPIAISLLAVSHQLETDVLDKTLITGELALDGRIRPVKGLLPMTVTAREQGYEQIVVPEENGPEAAVVKGIDVYPFRYLEQVIRWLAEPDLHDPLQVNPDQVLAKNGHREVVDFSDVRGQENVKRSLEVAAAGGHNLIMVGPPGSGKTMMARRLPTILPPLSLDEGLETTKIHSVAGCMKKGEALVANRPFRSPHHTVSDVALVGGGGVPMPGEISLAHNGVLFLDELPEFKRSALEVMRQPLEDGIVTISRSRMTVKYPSRVILVASMNPSPSGDWYDPSDPESVSPARMQRYLNKISGPLLDRIDIHVEVTKVGYDELSNRTRGEGSESIQRRVIEARKVQQSRFQSLDGVHSNAQMNTRLVRKICKLDSSSRKLLKQAITRLGLSARAYDRILKVARTIGDLEQSDAVKSSHVAEAIQYRSLDREGWLG